MVVLNLTAVTVGPSVVRVVVEKTVVEVFARSPTSSARANTAIKVSRTTVLVIPVTGFKDFLVPAGEQPVETYNSKEQNTYEI